MTPLESTLLAPDRREKLVADCVRLIEAQVASRGPIRRIALGAGLAMLEALKPRALERAVGALLPEFAAALGPLYQRFLDSKRMDFSQFLDEHPVEAVDALIGVTDRHARASANAALRSAYRRLRGSAEDEVRSALPGLGRVLSMHMAD
jgi:hypothetical protein|nr:hypothetical protein [Panacagrimonas sp.]